MTILTADEPEFAALSNDEMPAAFHRFADLDKQGAHLGTVFECKGNIGLLPFHVFSAFHLHFGGQLAWTV